MQASQQGVIWTMAICTVIILAGAYFMIPDTQAVPTAAEISAAVLAGIVIPEAAPGTEAGNYDEILAQICESDNIDCEGTHIDSSDKKSIAQKVFDEGIEDSTNATVATEDFEELLNLDKSYIGIVNVRYDAEEYEVTTANEDARDDGDYTVKQLVRVSWTDDDLDETQTAYYVVTSTIEDYSGDNDVELETTEEVERDFEFE